MAGCRRGVERGPDKNWVADTDHLYVREMGSVSQSQSIPTHIAEPRRSRLLHVHTFGPRQIQRYCRCVTSIFAPPSSSHASSPDGHKSSALQHSTPANLPLSLPNLAPPSPLVSHRPLTPSSYPHLHSHPYNRSFLHNCLRDTLEPHLANPFHVRPRAPV